jgi:hypothetical protein
MAELLNFKSWDDTPSWSNNFNMISKFTDLGSPDGNKSILGVLFNASVATESTAASPSIYVFSIRYRLGLDSPFYHLATFNNINQGTTIVNKGDIDVVKMLPSPIRGVKNIQLQIKGLAMRNDVGVNDFGLMFRTYRDSSLVNFDEQ